jgi:glutamine---fructose-6-phosphate transaminase (isomerizing)
MDYYQAVGSQPANLERSAVSVRNGLEDKDLTPWRNGVLAVASMGASTHAGHALVDCLRRNGRRAFNLDASSIMMLADAVDLADSYVFVSEGGRSRETVDAASRVQPGRRLGLTNQPDSPFGEVIDVVVDLGHGPDSPVYTVGYTATLQAFGLLAEELCHEYGGEDWKSLPGQVEETLSTCAPVIAGIASGAASLSSVDFVGCGASLSSAAEGALLLRESTRMATAAFETYQYLHGPMESLDVDCGCIIFGNEREVQLAGYLAERGVFTLLVTSAEVQPQASLRVVQIPEVGPISRTILEILPVQLLAGELARLRGLEIKDFLYHQDDSKIAVGTGLLGN